MTDGGHRDPDPIDPRACPKCRSSVHVEPTNSYEQARTGKRWVCTADSTYFAKVAES